MESNFTSKFDYNNNISSISSGSVTGSGITQGSFNVDSGFNKNSIQTVPNDQHPLNVDTNPILIQKKPNEHVEHVQNVSLRFLKPPQPAQPGDITIVQNADTRAPSPPPLVIRKDVPGEPVEPQPLVIREKPPATPVAIPDKIITIPGKIFQKPRKIIIEHVFREVRYENVPPQLTREQIKKYIKDKLRRQKSSTKESPSIEFESKENGSTSMLTNVSALLNETSKNSAPNVSHASASFTSRPLSRNNASAQFVTSNNSTVLGNLTNKSHASIQPTSNASVDLSSLANKSHSSIQYTSNASADLSSLANKSHSSIQYTSNASVDLSNITNKSNASIQYTLSNPGSKSSNGIENNDYINNNNRFSNDLDTNAIPGTQSNHPMQVSQPYHVNSPMPLHVPRTTPMSYYPGYEPPQSHIFPVNNFSRQNMFYATGPIRQYRSLSRAPPTIQYENNYSSLSAEFIPNRTNMTEIDIYNRMNVHQNSFRRSASVMRPQHEDAETGLRLLGFNL